MIGSTSVAVVIPAYCAEKTIRKVIDGIPEWIQFIIVVDDCSPDKSGEVVRSINKNPKIHLIHHEENQGVGGAMLTGYQKALEIGAEIVVKMDSDGQMDPDYIEKLVTPIINGEADYTKGNRFMFGSGLHKMPLLRKLGNTLLSFFTKISSGYWHIFDPTNGYTAIQTRILQRINLSNISKSFFFETSVLLELGIYKAVVHDVFIPGIYDGEESHLSEFKTSFEFPPKLIKGFFRRIIYQYFIRDFNAVSLLLVSGTAGILFGSIWGGVNWKISSAKNVTTPTGTIMIAVLPIILGVQLVLQALILDIQNVPKEVINKDI